MIISLSEAIKQMRLNLGFSQEELARELHVGFTSVNQWKNNHAKANKITRHAIFELCKSKKTNSELLKNSK